MAKLNDKQRRFVDEYLIDLNATQAAIRAGYSKKTAASQGERLLRNAEIQALIQERMAERGKRTEISQDSIVKELARIAFGDPRKVMEWGPSGVKLRPSTELSDEEAAIVSEVSETTSANGGSLKLKTNDKLKALELLGRHMGMFKEKVELTGPDGGPVKTETAVVDEQAIAAAVERLKREY